MPVCVFMLLCVLCVYDVMFSMCVFSVCLMLVFILLFFYVFVLFVLLGSDCFYVFVCV